MLFVHSLSLIEIRHLLHFYCLFLLGQMDIRARKNIKSKKRVHIRPVQIEMAEYSEYNVLCPPIVVILLTCD